MSLKQDLVVHHGKKQSQIVGDTAVMIKPNIKIFTEVFGTNGHVSLNHFSKRLK